MLTLPGIPARTLRHRAFLPMLASALLVFGTTVAVLQTMMSQLTSERIRSRSTAVAHMVANAVETENEPAELRRLVTALGAEPQIDQIVVTMGSPPRIVASTRGEWMGKPVAATHDARLAAQMARVTDARREAGERRSGTDLMAFAVPITRERVDGPSDRGAVAVVVDGRLMRAQTRTWLLRFGALVLLLELLAFGAGELALRHYVLKPLDQIAAAAARRRAGDRGARAHVRGDDEFGRLAAALNEGHDELNAIIEELEFQKYALDQAATVCVTDALGKIVYVNDAYCEMFGYSRAELLGHNPRIINSGHHPPEFFAGLYDTLAAGRVWRGEIRNRAKDGHFCWVHSTVIPSLDADGRPTRFTAVLYDISERKAAEQEARLANQRFRDVADTTPALIWLSEEGEGCTFYNQRWLDFTGRTFEQERGEGWIVGVHPDDLDRFGRTFEAARAEQQPFEMEYRLRRHDGEYRTLLDRGVPRFVDGVFRGYIGSCVDITERSRSERELRASEARVRQIVDTAIDAVVTIDHESVITGWNRQAEQVFGWSAAEVLGRTLGETIIPLQYRAAHARGIGRFLKTGQANVLGQRLEITALRRDGEEFPVEISISAMPEENGAYFSAFVRDISERKKAETELVRAKEAAQSASRAKSEFLATMSHEIRTPMNGVIGFTDLLIETGLDATQREYAETIRSSGQALLALINDILDFSKIEAGKLDVERVAFDARRAAGEVVELLSARAAERGIEVVFEWPEELPRDLVGDPMRFRQVLLNLAGNAVKFTETGCVFVHAERDGDAQLRLLVRDTGIGIAEDKLVNLFRKFSQADSSTTRRFGGTGLGLAISKQLVELMGGSIGAESRPGHGSTFWFTLPFSTAPAVTEPAVPAPDISGMRVLVVDDLVSNRQVLCSLLAHRGVEAVPAANAAEAMVLLHAAHAGERPFRAAVLDLRMPDTDGEMLGQAILADPTTGAPALLLLTSGTYRHEAPHFLAQGFAAVLFKPVVRPDLLVEAIARATRPAADNAAADAAALAAAPAAVVHDEAALMGKRVLLAEDQPVNQKLALRVLGKFGCSVDLAENGIDACALAAATDYDLILMDCHMPEMDGFEATSAIRSSERELRARGESTRHTPIVALTASVLKEDRDRCFASGMDDFVSKPFRPDQLRTVLERWTLGGRDSERPAREAA